MHMAAVVDIVSRHGLNTDVRHRNQSKLALYKHIYSCLKQLHMHNKTEHFSYKGEYGVHTCIDVFKRRAGFGYR